MLGVVDKRQLALRCQCFDELIEVLVGLGQAGDVGHLRQALTLELLGQRLAVVENQVGAQFAYPSLGLWARGGTDDLQARQLAGQLREDRAHSAACTDDQQALSFISLAFAYLQALEQQFPSRNGSQWQGGGLGESQACGHVPDNPLIDHMQLAIGASAGDGAGVEHLVARLEQADFAAHGLDHASNIPAQHLGDAPLGLDILAHLGIDGVHRDGLDLYQQVARAGNRLGQLNVLQRSGIGDGKRMSVGNGFHKWTPRAGLQRAKRND
ncbi:hypothetical protein D3C85_839040 [compost metagenome]